MTTIFAENSGFDDFDFVGDDDCWCGDPPCTHARPSAPPHMLDVVHPDGRYL